MSGAVFRLVRRSHEETVETLRWMLREAERGRKFDFAGLMLDDDGAEAVIRTGRYRADCAHALMAALRMSKHIMEAYDSAYGPPK